MTTIAKMIVFVNLALGLVFAIWVTGLYQNRRDFPAEHKARAEEIDRLRKVISGQGDAIPGAEVRWQLADRRVKETEKKRPALQKFYAERLEFLRTGKGGGQILELVYDKGKLDVDPATGQPKFGPVLDAARQPIPGLANLTALKQNYTNVQTQLATTLADSEKALAQVKELTGKIGDGLRAGLRFDLAVQERELKKSLDQHEYLQPLLYNRLAEVDILTKRHKSLEARLDELKATTVAEKR